MALKFKNAKRIEGLDSNVWWVSHVIGHVVKFPVVP